MVSCLQTFALATLYLFCIQNEEKETFKVMSELFRNSTALVVLQLRNVRMKGETCLTALSIQCFATRYPGLDETLEDCAFEIWVKIYRCCHDRFLTESE